MESGKDREEKRIKKERVNKYIKAYCLNTEEGNKLTKQLNIIKERNKC